MPPSKAYVEAGARPCGSLWDTYIVILLAGESKARRASPHGCVSPWRRLNDSRRFVRQAWLLLELGHEDLIP